MGRPAAVQELPKRNADTPLIGKGEHLKHWDKYMVKVHRRLKKVKGQTQPISVTFAVTIDRLIRRDVKIDEKTAMMQNFGQDHQNDCEGGQPAVQWYFPKDTVKQGMSFAAKDKVSELDEDEEPDETQQYVTKIVGSKNEPAKYLVIDLKKEIETPSMQ